MHTIAANRGNRIIQMSVAGSPGSDRTKAKWFEIRRSRGNGDRRRTDQSQWRSRKSLPTISLNRIHEHGTTKKMIVTLFANS